MALISTHNFVYRLLIVINVTLILFNMGLLSYRFIPTLYLQSNLATTVDKPIENQVFSDTYIMAQGSVSSSDAMIHLNNTNGVVNIDNNSPYLSLFVENSVSKPLIETRSLPNQLSLFSLEQPEVTSDKAYFKNSAITIPASTQNIFLKLRVTKSLLNANLRNIESPRVRIQSEDSTLNITASSAGNYSIQGTNSAIQFTIPSISKVSVRTFSSLPEPFKKLSDNLYQYGDDTSQNDILIDIAGTHSSITFSIEN